MSLSKNQKGIYVHFPYCSVKCGFCDFYSLQGEYNGHYFSTLINELKLYESLGLINEKQFSTLYFGGGTPSLALSKDLSLFFDYLKTNGYLNSITEITLEANPENITKEKLEFYKSLGINRISLGVQSLNESTLKTLGRTASLEKTIQSILLVQEYFNNYSLDFMYGIKGQDLCQELFSFGSLRPPHFSTYMFSLEKTVPFYLNKDQLLKYEDDVAQEYQDLNEFMITSGYKHYEISSFALDGKESLHNQCYWLRNEYLGLGAGASGYINGIRYTNFKIHEYIKRVELKKLPYESSEQIEAIDQLMEDIMLKSRLTVPFSIQDHLDLLQKSDVEKIDQFFNDLHNDQYLKYDSYTKTIVPYFRTWIFLDWITKKFFSMLQEQGLYHVK